MRKSKSNLIQVSHTTTEQSMSFHIAAAKHGNFAKPPGTPRLPPSNNQRNFTGRNTCSPILRHHRIESAAKSKFRQARAFECGKCSRSRSQRAGWHRVRYCMHCRAAGFFGIWPYHRRHQRVIDNDESVSFLSRGVEQALGGYVRHLLSSDCCKGGRFANTWAVLTSAS